MTKRLAAAETHPEAKQRRFDWSPEAMFKFGEPFDNGEGDCIWTDCELLVDAGGLPAGTKFAELMYDPRKAKWMGEICDDRGTALRVVVFQMSMTLTSVTDAPAKGLGF